MKQVIRVTLPSGVEIDMVPFFVHSRPDTTLSSEVMQNVAVREVSRFLRVESPASMVVLQDHEMPAPRRY